MTTLTVENLQVSLGGRTVLHGIGAKFAAGGLIGLIGPNGAGKSTLVRAMAHLVDADRGTILIDGQDIRALKRQDLSRRVAYLPQGHALHWPLRADHVVSLGRLPYQSQFSAETREDRDAIDRAMVKTDVVQFADRAVTTLSSGERARIMLARALAVEAPILLADEPVASLDPYHQLHVMELMRTLAREGRLVVVVLHDLPLAARFCDRLVMLHDGKLVADGVAREVLSPENLERTYSVEGVYGEEKDEQFVLAWRRLVQAAEPEAARA